MAEDTTTNPADLVPFVDNPDPTPTATREEAAKELGYDIENVEKGIGVMQTIREYVDAIPTPGRDEGDALGSFSLFSMTKDVLNGALTLMEAPRTGILRDNPEVGFQAVADMGPGMMSVASRGPAGAIGMFGSRPSKFASQETHDKWATLQNTAVDLEKQGHTPTMVWQKTGMSKDHEGKWVYEISDGPENTKINWDAVENKLDPSVAGEGAESALSDILDMPMVYEHWPELKGIKIKGYSGARDEYGEYNLHTQTISINYDKIQDPKAIYTLRDILLHETQHALQHMQNRPSGTNSVFASVNMENAVKAAERAYDRHRRRGGDLSPQQEEAIWKNKKIVQAWNDLKVLKDDMAAYWADPGEVEARLAAKAGNHRLDDTLNTRPASDAPMSNVRRADADVPRTAFSPDDLRFPDPDDDAILQRALQRGRTFGKRQTPPSESRAPYDGSSEGAPNLPANQQRGTLTDDIMDDLSVYQMSQRQDRDFYMNYINERMKPFALEMAEPDNVNLSPQRRAGRLSARAEEIQIRKGTIRALLGEGDDPSVWNAVRINQDVIRRLEEEMTALSGSQ